MIAEVRRVQRGARERVELERREIASRGAKTVSGTLAHQSGFSATRKSGTGTKRVRETRRENGTMNRRWGCIPSRAGAHSGLLSWSAILGGTVTEGTATSWMTSPREAWNRFRPGTRRARRRVADRSGFRCVAAALRRIASDDGNVVRGAGFDMILRDRRVRHGRATSLARRS